MSHVWTDTRSRERFFADMEPAPVRDSGNDLVDCLTGGTTVVGVIAAIAFSVAGVLFLSTKLHGFFQLVWVFAGIALTPFFAIEMLMLFRWWGALALLVAACAMYSGL
jgi:hypothetical protein